MYRIAQALRNLGQYQLALETYKKTLSICQLKEGRCLDIGREYHHTGTDIIQEIGELYFTLKQYSEALNYFQQKKSNGYVFGWEDNKNLGITYEKLGNIDLALKYFNKVLSDRGPGCGDGEVADATIIEAVRQDSGTDNDGSECAGSRETWIPSLSIAAFHTAEIYRRRGQYDLAIDIYRSLARFGRRAAILSNLGTLYKAQGDYNKALKNYQEALWLRRKGGSYLGEKDAYGEALSLNNIGEIYRRQGQYSKSLKTYKQALEIFRNLINSLTAAQATITPFQDINTVRQGEASVLHNFGSVYYDLGQYGKALDFYQQSLSLSKALNDKAAEGRSLNNIGLVYEAQQQYAQALEFYQRALTARREAEDLPGEAGTLNNIGLVYNKLGQPGQGVEPLQQALAVFQKLEDKASEANTLDSLGTLYTALGQYSQALDSYQTGLRLVKDADLPPLEGVIFSHLGNLLVKTSQPELAIVFYKQSVNIRETIRKDIRTLPLEQQESYTQTVAGTYRSLASLLINQGRLPEAQAVLELLKLRELDDFTRSADRGQDTTGIALSKTEAEALKKILARFTTVGNFGKQLAECEQQQCAELEKLQAQQKSLNDAIRQELKTLYAKLKNQEATDLGFLNTEKFNATARSVVNAQPGTVLIYPLIVENKIQFLLAIKAGDSGVTFRRFENPNITAQQLFQTISTFHDQLSQTADGVPLADEASVKATSSKLYDALIRPLEAELNPQNIHHLVFALDQSTRYIPMAALFDAQRNQYLIQRYSISTILAATETDTKTPFPQPQTPQDDFLMAMGAAVFPSGEAPLKNVPAELAAIVKTHAKDSHGIFPGSEDLDAAFSYRTLLNKLKGHRILHLATHGKFVAGRPEESFILSGAGERLTTDKIEYLGEQGKLDGVHMVVLSACETAVGGKNSAGIEIPGISYYFLKHDVKAVIASLWLVSDASTSLLMQEFYKQLATGHYSKTEALQQAQLKLLKQQHKDKERTDQNAPSRASGERYIPGRPAPGDFSHPYYWAPFILIGNGL